MRNVKAIMAVVIFLVIAVSCASIDAEDENVTVILTYHDGKTLAYVHVNRWQLWDNGDVQIHTDEGQYILVPKRLLKSMSVEWVTAPVEQEITP